MRQLPGAQAAATNSPACGFGAVLRTRGHHRLLKPIFAHKSPAPLSDSQQILLVPPPHRRCLLASPDRSSKMSPERPRYLDQAPSYEVLRESRAAPENLALSPTKFRVRSFGR